MGDESKPTWFDAFAPETGDKGISGVMTSLSADQAFMESAMEAFTAQGPGSRRADGRIAMTLLADRKQAELPPIPGLCQAYCRADSWSPDQLQHSKIALLTFGPAIHGRATELRLLVSTGNWTMQTAGGSIDLLWKCDLRSRPRDASPSSIEATDILAAVDFLTILLRRYVLPPPVEQAVQKIIAEARRLARPHLDGPPLNSRFIATLGARAEATTAVGWARGSIGAQIIERFGSGPGRRNLLICGSGFFEQATANGQEPRILEGLVSSLRRLGYLAKDLDPTAKVLVANPGTSGAVASWVRAGGAQRDGWTLRKPCHPQTSASDPFHAKFILLANRRERITGGQLYFGSGNLSIQGLLKGCLSVESSDHGNVEAGIVVEVETVDEDELFKALGIDLESEVDPLSFPDDASDESSDQASEAIRPTPPILAAVWHYEHRHFVFVRPPNEQRECTVRSGTFSSVVPASTTTMTLPEGVYPETRLEISVAGQSNWSVPVFIEGGGFYRGEAEKFGFDDALVRLQDFPGHGNCDDDETVDGEDEGENPSGDESKKTEKAKRAVRTSFLLHRMMSLVEAVAERNQTVDREQFPDWVAHLRRVLIEEMDPGEIADVKSLGVNVLYPLLAERGFAPPFSDRTYQGIMEQVTERWGLAGFPGFEASDHAGVALP